MLVLSRKANEKFHFPALGISIQVVKVQDTHVKLGIEAPKEFRVLREELLTRDSDYKIHPSVTKTLGVNGTRLRKAAEANRQAETRALNLAEIQRQLDAINLALFAAQTEVQQETNCQQNLDEAIAALQSVENQLAAHPGWRKQVSERVGETACDYATTAREVLCVGDAPDTDSRRVLAAVFGEKNEFATLRLLGSTELSEAFKTKQADAVVIPMPEFSSIKDRDIEDIGQIPPVTEAGGLRFRGIRKLDGRNLAIFRR